MTESLPPRYSRPSAEERVELAEKAAEMYRGGASMREISAELGRSYGFIHRLLTEGEVPLRRRGGGHGKPSPLPPGIRKLTRAEMREYEDRIRTRKMR